MIQAMFIRLNFLWFVLLCVLFWPLIRVFFWALVFLFAAGALTIAGSILWNRFQGQRSLSSKTNDPDKGQDPLDADLSRDAQNAENADFREKKRTGP